MKFTIQMFGFSTNVFIKSNEEKSSYVLIWFIINYVKSQIIIIFHVHVDGEGKGLST